MKVNHIDYSLLISARSGIRASCYFCSQPIFNNIFAKLSTVVDGAVVTASSCSTCKNKLKATKKVNILFFKKDGKKVHWSIFQDYIPTIDFWDMNKLTVEENEQALSLRLVSNDTKARHPLTEKT